MPSEALRRRAREEAAKAPTPSPEKLEELRAMFQRFHRENRAREGDGVASRQRVQQIIDGQASGTSSLGPMFGPPPPVLTTLYRHYDHDGVLLYIGITNHPGSRITSHRLTSRWFEFVDLDRESHEHYPARELAEEAETAAIATEQPLFNRRKTDRDYARTIRYLAERDRLDLLTVAWS